MIAILTLLMVLALSLSVTRIGTMILMVTGMSKESAKFQARSAFTGVGFTTSEAEEIMHHPVRRRIVMGLMLAGNLGIASVVSTVILSFVSTSNATHWWWNVILLASGIIALLFLGLNKTFEIWFNKRIYSTITKFTQLKVKDYISLLQLKHGYAVTEMLVSSNDWIAGKTILDSALSKEGILILGIQEKDGEYHGAPSADTTINPGDTLLLYSTTDRIKKLDQRRKGEKGEQERKDAVNAHMDSLKKQNLNQSKDDTK